MNWEQAKGKWNQLRGPVKAKWARLTDNDLELIAGKRGQLIVKLQERYNVSWEEAEKQVNEWNPGLDVQAVGDQPSQRKAG
jgi:uncharacterized protein YjbJ (UPF0337 family)